LQQRNTQQHTDKGTEVVTSVFTNQRELIMKKNIFWVVRAVQLLCLYLPNAQADSSLWQLPPGTTAVVTGKGVICQ
jgi:hypothetical protein